VYDLMQKLEHNSIDQILHDAKIPIRVAFIKPNQFPNVISLWYVNINEKIYCATQKSAKIISYLQNNPICGFEIAADKPPYKGIRGEGSVKIIEDNGSETLEVLIDKYLGKKESPSSKFLRDNSKTEVSIEITPSKVFYYDYSKRMKDV